MSRDQPCNVFLVSCVQDSVMWRSLGAGTTYYTEMSVSGSPVTGHETWFIASQQGARCVVEWKSPSIESPFADGAPRTELSHGEHFAVGGTTYVAYVEAESASWDDPPAPPSAHDQAVLGKLRGISTDKLLVAAKRFLALPYASRWWASEFASRTGFVQFRNGKVPNVNEIKMGIGDMTVRLQWTVCVWDMFARAWIPESEQASFTREVGGDSLAVLLDCATVLAVIPVDK